jgi:GTP-binding protein
MFFDARETISRVDKQLVEEIAENHKPCIFVVNKWDLADDMTSGAWGDYLLAAFNTMRHVPVAFVTAKNGRNVKTLINLAQSIFKQARIRVPTARVNKVVRAAIQKNAPPTRKNRHPKIYYASQVATEPPTIVLSCNDPALIDESWRRYLLGVLREELPFREVPIRLHLHARRRDEPAHAAKGGRADQPSS